MDDFEDRYFSINRRLMLLFGFWHTQPYWERFVRITIAGFVLICSLIVQFCQFFTLELDWLSVVPLLQTFIPFICFVLLSLSCLINYVTIQKLYSAMRQDWNRTKDDVEVEIMEKHAYQSKLFTLVCGVAFFLFIVLLTWSPSLYKILTLDEESKVTDRFPIFACIDYVLNPETYYYPILIQEILSFITLLLIALGSYSTFVCFIQHVCAHLSIMKGKIKEPKFINDQYKNHLVKRIDVSNWIIDIIQRMAQIRKFMIMLNTVSEKCYLVQVVLAFFLLVVDFVCMPVLLEHKENRKDAFIFIIFIFATLFPIYVNCHIGQRLIDYSTEVYKEACLIPIHEISLKSQKILLTMLMMNAKPYSLSIGKVYISSHKFFSDLLRTSLSFAMVVHSLQNV